MTKISGAWLTNAATQSIMSMLLDAGYQAYFVGGCVRNALFEIAVNDIDIATDALPEKVIELANTANLRVIPTGIDHGTVTVIADGTPFEITTFRRDVETDGRRAVVSFSTDISEDARRRDFTMNAIYADAEGTVLDPLGGLNDIHSRQIRFVGDADARIKEDYLRTLRFFRFHAWYGNPDTGMDADAIAAISANLDGLDTLSGERTGAEIKKLFSATNPAPAVGVMSQTGVLMRVLPGSDSQFLAPLTHLDEQFPTNPIRRLAILGGDDTSNRLRLSRQESRQLDLLRENIGNAEPSAVLAYRFGATYAADIELLRAVMFERPLDPNLHAETDCGTKAQFPVKAVDLMPELQGPALGAHLNRLQERWIASDFELTKAQLLAE